MIADLKLPGFPLTGNGQTKENCGRSGWGARIVEMTGEIRDRHVNRDHPPGACLPSRWMLEEVVALPPPVRRLDGAFLRADRAGRAETSKTAIALANNSASE
jgi:hypothetical protein